MSALRFWEEQGLLTPGRDADTGYRRYDSRESAKVTLIALLRATGYRFGVIAQILDELAAGNPEQMRRALESRLTHLDEVSAGCLAASAALHGYLRAWGPPDLPPASDWTPRNYAAPGPSWPGRRNQETGMEPW